MFLHNLLNVLVQIANKMGLQKKYPDVVSPETTGNIRDDAVREYPLMISTVMPITNICYNLKFVQNTRLKNPHFAVCKSTCKFRRVLA
jgi:hypothetical protein